MKKINWIKLEGLTTPYIWGIALSFVIGTKFVDYPLVLYIILPIIILIGIFIHLKSFALTQKYIYEIEDQITAYKIVLGNFNNKIDYLEKNLEEYRNKNEHLN
jgi:hypothetical protein